MQAGVDALYNTHDPQAAVVAFRKVLALDPNYRGANFHLALALEEAGKMDEARTQWQKVLTLAEAGKDKPIADTARAHLAKNP
jgi:cytochrome c-type biogenesis protein CcmH/NrfG